MTSTSPIKVLHLADIHIGMENYGRLDPQSGLNSRVLDFLRRLSEVIDYALANDVDLCIFAGDAYKNQRPNPTLQREFARRILRLSQAGVPTVLLVGNHDMSTADRAASSLDIFSTLDVPNIIVGNREAVHRLKTRRGQEVQVVTVPYPQRQRLLSRDEFRDLSIEALDQTLQEIVMQNIRDLAAEAQQVPTLPTILTGHFSVNTATQGSEQSVMIGRDVIVLQSVLTDPAWDYVALGHIHKHQVLNRGQQPPLVYPGSLERIDFGEEKEEKGFVMVELQRGHADWRFIPVQSRPFRTIRIDVRQSDDPMTRILDEIDRHEIDEAVVRVIIQANETQDPLIEDRLIQQQLRQASYLAGIRHDVDRQSRRRLGETDLEALDPETALSLYFDSIGTANARKTELLQQARRIIRDDNELPPA